MRWLWIDRILSHEPGRRLSAVKCVSMAEEHLHDHFPAEDGLPPTPVMPASLILEGMAQTAGILVGAVNDFREKVVLAKIAAAELRAEVKPGETIRYEAMIERMDDAGASTSGAVDRLDPASGEWTRIGEVEMTFSHLDRSRTSLEVPEENFVFGENFRVVLGALREVAAAGAGGGPGAGDPRDQAAPEP